MKINNTHLHWNLLKQNKKKKFNSFFSFFAAAAAASTFADATAVTNKHIHTHIQDEDLYNVTKWRIKKKMPKLILVAAAAAAATTTAKAEVLLIARKFIFVSFFVFFCFWCLDYYTVCLRKKNLISSNNLLYILHTLPKKNRTNY